LKKNNLKTFLLENEKFKILEISIFERKKNLIKARIKSSLFKTFSFRYL